MYIPSYLDNMLHDLSWCALSTCKPRIVGWCWGGVRCPPKITPLKSCCSRRSCALTFSISAWVSAQFLNSNGGSFCLKRFMCNMIWNQNGNPGLHVYICAYKILGVPRSPRSIISSQNHPVLWCTKFIQILPSRHQILIHAAAICKCFTLGKQHNFNQLIRASPSNPTQRQKPPNPKRAPRCAVAAAPRPVHGSAGLRLPGRTAGSVHSLGTRCSNRLTTEKTGCSCSKINYL